ncbi:bifunctional diguanylate cyclase/phosphodiesterase [Dokdonella koreensis]|uniref:Diguanylate cyclase/phosphodiesterase n=1 Tax=Dokdonella koreensis DS-123 TaxID=1300342 RepID=A0A160DY41_9GAMM|nr:diguanylate cyclase [Dokdonella koreensis]ANB19330.1 Diguanylate cyclase/phosphodiesterase [Dokdonella koreensis DS-123]
MSAWEEVALRPATAGPAQARTRRRGLRAHLAILVVIALLPALAAIAIAVWRAGSAYHAASRYQLLASAQVMARAVESELAANVEVIATLAAPAARTDDATVPARAGLAQIAERFGGRLDLHAASAPAAPLPEPLRGAVAQAADEGRWVVSDLFEADGAVRLGVAVPYPDGDGRDVLALTARPEYLVRALRRAGSVPAQTLVAITDGQGRLIARSRDPDRAVGRTVPDWAALQAVGGAAGVFEARAVEGAPVIFGFRVLANTPGWVVVVGESRDAFDARWQGPLLGLVAGSALAILLALLLAIIAARWILRPVQALARRAEHVAGIRPDVVEPRELVSSVAEFEALRESLDRSESALRHQAEAERLNAAVLIASERRYRALAEAGALVLWRRAVSGAVTAVAGWQPLTGRPDAAAIGDGWLEQVHPEDLASVAQRWEQGRAARSPVDAEFRVRTADDRWLWVRARGVPVSGEDGEAEEWVGVLEDVDKRRQEQERLAHLALHDPLTGLPNRAQLADRMRVVIAGAADGRRGALLLLDLDGFKEVNDTHGHPTGDALLCLAAERLRALAGATDVIIRLGGDEFAIVRSHPHAGADDGRLAEAIIDSLGAPYELDGCRVVIGVSVGIAPIVRGDEDTSRLVREADGALYRAKAAGRGRYRVVEAAAGTSGGEATPGGHP